MSHRINRLPFLRWSALLLIFALLTSTGPTSQAQSNSRYFPETGHFLSGVFRTFWEGNGGVAIFGYPITEEYIGNNGRITQYFERARFELVDQGGQSVVELGKLGVEITQGRIFPKVPPIPNTADRRYIPETQHIIQYGFKQIWETRGGERIFGYPISEEIDEVLENGEWHTVQYFERVRFEYWPERADGDRVLISNLGRMLAPPNLTAPRSPDAGPATPSAPSQPSVPANVPPGVNARVVPDTGPPGTTFRLEASGFEAGERVGIWATAPDQSVIPSDFQAVADDQGSITHENITITSNDNFADGIWSFNAQGIESKKAAVGYFRISRSSTAPPSSTPQPAPTSAPSGFNNCQSDPNPDAAPHYPLQLTDVDKGDQVVTLTNVSPDTIDVSGWHVCSLNGDQEHTGLSGSLAPGEKKEFDYSGDGRIWNDDEADNGALYNQQGQLVSYWRDPDNPQQPAATATPAPATPQPTTPPQQPGNNRLETVVQDQIPKPQGDAFILPIAGPVGSLFEMSASGYTPGEEINAWVTAPDNSSIPLDSSNVQLDSSGRLRMLVSSEQLTEGTYTVVAQGKRSNTLGAASFLLTSQFIAGPGTARPPNINGSATPAEGGLNTVFQIRGQNLRANEALELWLTEPGGTYALLPNNTNADNQGRVGYNPSLDLRATSDFKPGVYGIHFRGRSSGTRVSVYFTYTGVGSSSLDTPARQQPAPAFWGADRDNAADLLKRRQTQRR